MDVFMCDCCRSITAKGGYCGGMWKYKLAENEGDLCVSCMKKVVNFLASITVQPPGSR